MPRSSDNPIAHTPLEDEMTYELVEECYVCEGTGTLEDDSGNKETPCPECHGAKTVTFIFLDYWKEIPPTSAS